MCVAQGTVLCFVRFCAMFGHVESQMKRRDQKLQVC